MRPVVKKKVFEDPHDTDSGNIIYYWKLLLMTSVPMVIGTSTFHLTNLVDMVMFNKALPITSIIRLRLRHYMVFCQVNTRS